MLVFLNWRFAGSGRESLTQLATSMAGSTLVRVNVTHNYGVKKFEGDLKPAVLAAGVHAKHVVFLLKDAQVRRQQSASNTLCYSRLNAHMNRHSNRTCPPRPNLDPLRGACQDSLPRMEDCSRVS